MTMWVNELPSPDYVRHPGILSDVDIAHLCVNTDTPMITPFSEKLSEVGTISHGLSSMGYDALLADSFKIFTNVNNALVDPKNFSPECFVERTGDTCIIPPNSFALGHTIETFCIPKDVLGMCIGKSTYARCGIIVNVTPLESGWEGQVTIEIHNTTPLPAIVYANEGICQFVFWRAANPCKTPYNARGGKYMGQKGVVLPKIYQDS
jgi:dCTP deaminase